MLLPTWANANKFPWSFYVGTVSKIPVRLHVTYLLLLVAQALGSAFYGLWAVLLWLLLTGPVLLLTILIHELGHCWAARSVGGAVEGILLWPLGGLAFMTLNTTYKRAIWVAIAGPLTHLPMIAMWLLALIPARHATTGSYNIDLAMPPVDKRHFGHALCAYAVVINISLLVFNLFVPAYPLDGGRITTLLLLMAGVFPRSAAIIITALSTAIGIGLFVFGCIIFQMVTILVAVFILLSALQLYLSIRNNKLQEHPLFASVNAEAAFAAAAAAAAAHPQHQPLSGGPGKPGKAAAAAAQPPAGVPVSQMPPQPPHAMGYSGTPLQPLYYVPQPPYAPNQPQPHVGGHV